MLESCGGYRDVAGFVRCGGGGGGEGKEVEEVEGSGSRRVGGGG